MGMTKKQRVEQVEALLESAPERMEELVNFLGEKYEVPFDALVTMMLTTSLLAKTMGMPVATLVEGIEKAYETLDDEDAKLLQ